ncbi:hypothetical protein HY838_01175 [Candidatus Azambacteria bacterium]|nr:hypothetical protein [Candidatus Azambacteria bacterium]
MEIENNFEWKIEEPDFTPKSAEWFWALGILAFALVVFSILLKNYLLIAIVALAMFIIYANKNQKPELINFRLDGEGFHIEKKISPYEDFESFWIFPAHIGKNPELVLRRKRHLSPLLVAPFYGDDENKIRAILEKYLPEKEEQESLIDLLRKRFF